MEPWITHLITCLAGFILGLKVMDWRWRYSVNQYGGKQYIERGDVMYKVKEYK